MDKRESRQIWRALDANFNRAKEGLRVCEDVCRFCYAQERWTREYKNIRHRLTGCLESLSKARLFAARDAVHDVGSRSGRLELKRRNLDDIFYANAQRVKESVRVMEEFAKLIDVPAAEKLKRLRYDLYALEQRVILKK